MEPDGELYLVGEAHTSDGDGVGAVQLDDDGEFGADLSTHCSIDLQRKLHALVRAAAVGIRSPVGFRAEELAEQVGRVTSESGRRPCRLPERAPQPRKIPMSVGNSSSRNGRGRVPCAFSRRAEAETESGTPGAGRTICRPPWLKA